MNRKDNGEVEESERMLEEFVLARIFQHWCKMKVSVAKPNVDVCGAREWRLPSGRCQLDARCSIGDELKADFLSFLALFECPWPVLLFSPLIVWSGGA